MASEGVTVRAAAVLTAAEEWSSLIRIPAWVTEIDLHLDLSAQGSVTSITVKAESHHDPDATAGAGFTVPKEDSDNALTDYAATWAVAAADKTVLKFKAFGRLMAFSIHADTGTVTGSELSAVATFRGGNSR